jgi:hypothetical protein
MRYAIWKLSFTGDYGFGPEEEINAFGGKAESSFTQSQQNPFILGYVWGDVDLQQLSKYEFSFITQQEALLFMQEIDPSASLNAEGKFVIDAAELD